MSEVPPLVFGLYETTNIGTSTSLRAVTFSKEAAEQWVAENDQRKTWETRSYRQLAVWTGREEEADPVTTPADDELDDNERLAAIRELLNQASYQKNAETYAKFHTFTVDLLRLARGFEEDNI